MNDTQTAVLAGAALVWMLSSIWANVQLILERRAHSKERQALLDRIMSRSYQEYVYANKEDTSDVNQLTTDEIEAKWYEANRREMEREPEPAYESGVGL